MTQVGVRFQATPNPNAGKFVLDRKVFEGSGSRTFSSAAQAAADPLARALFEIAGVASIFMVNDFVTVTKMADVEWSALVPEIERAIRGALA